MPCGEELVYKQQDLDTICSACKNITQLSIGYPSYSIVRPLSGELHIFEFTIISHLKHLVTLNISSWPMNNVGGAHLPRPMYETLLQAVALRIFNLAAYWTAQPPEILTSPGPIPVSLPPEWKFDTTSTPRLRLVAFGISDPDLRAARPQDADPLPPLDVPGCREQDQVARGADRVVFQAVCGAGERCAEYVVAEGAEAAVCCDDGEGEGVELGSGGRRYRG